MAGPVGRAVRPPGPGLSPHAPQDFVAVVRAENQAEAELLQGLLAAEGVPSFLRRSAGSDVPDFLAAGPRDILVPAADEQVARELLRESDQTAESTEASR